MLDFQFELTVGCPRGRGGVQTHDAAGNFQPIKQKEK